MELQHVWLEGLKGWKRCIDYAAYQDFRTDCGGFDTFHLQAIYDIDELTLGVF